MAAYQILYTHMITRWLTLSSLHDKTAGRQSWAESSPWPVQGAP